MLTSNPGVFLSTINADIPLVPAVLSVTAKIINVSAKPEFVVNTFCPFKIYSSPSNTAFVFTPLASVPAPGSVRPKHPTLEPSTNGRKNFCFCSSEAKSLMQEQHNDVCTEIVIPVEASNLDISSIQSV